ncbi:hypothetical protein D3P06_11890 [Paracoccus aestuarii]|uniref:Uncharacterized protein n=1 Tax=Paracoccus aestuarii TaxID=453842 RepID=A0A418ZTD1_9RHOB|nr:hypothetical protein [Paracoccus aestuarii]RJL01878.1 hypothetical protein D3P06_11890 [Paracoccus aestuarii]WCQ98554.1 hypothetical protein JHW48_11700 [Paracoccus aestuarii]
MSDVLLLAGVALCLLSLVLAVVQLLQTQPPRAAALALVAGIFLLFVGAWTNPQPFGPDTIPAALDSVTGGGLRP